MTRALQGVTATAAGLLLAGCASVPRDSGFADVRKTIAAETRQEVEWEPARPVLPPDDAALQALLQDELSVERAVQIAFAHNRDVQATLEGLGIARAELIAAGTIRNPLAHGEVRFPGDPARPFEIGLTKSLLDLLQLGNRKKLGRAQFEAEKVRVSAAVINFAAEVRISYFDLLAARKVLARQDTILKAQEAATELSRRQHRAGNISDLDLENEQARYEQVKLEHARAQLEELFAREHLIANLGLVQRADLRLPEEFPPAPDSEPSEDEVVAQATARRLDIRIAQREIEAALRALGVAKTAALEGLEVGVHLEKEPDGKKTTGPSLETPIPIFDRGAAQKTRARAMLRQAQQRFAALTASARSEVRAARERLLEARARAGYLREVVIPRRDRIVKLTQLEYNAMLRGVFQLIEARQNLSSAQREEIVATRDYWVARTQLESALLGVSQFSVRREAAESEKMRPELFPPLNQQQSKAH
jgi:cobalt-zinc-cadmium efflux system outer membrane protein